MTGRDSSKTRNRDGTYAAQSTAAERQLAEIIGRDARAEERTGADGPCTTSLDCSTVSTAADDSAEDGCEPGKRRHPGYVWRLRTAADVQRAIAAVARQTARGELQPARARALNTLLGTLLRSFQAVDAEQRIAAIVAKLEAKGIKVA